MAAPQPSPDAGDPVAFAAWVNQIEQLIHDGLEPIDREVSA
ncbi:MAG: hypothetical protein WCJ30_23100 [Deltaproteobacteria bacterium]